MSRIQSLEEELKFSEQAKKGDISIDSYNKDACRKTAINMVRTSPFYNPDSYTFDFYGRRKKNKQFMEEVVSVRNSCYNFGIKRDEIVFMLLLNTPEMLNSLYGLNDLGAITEWFNPKAISVEMLRKHIIENDIKVLFSIDILYPILKEAIKGTQVEQVVINSVMDSFPVSKNILYKTQVFGLNSIVSNSFFRDYMSKLSATNQLRESDENLGLDQKSNLKLFKNLLQNINNYSEREKIRAKASFYLDNNKDSRFITYHDFVAKYNRKVAGIESRYEDNKISMIVHTGGSTGPVKRVAMTDYNINSAIYQSTLIPINMDPNDTFCQLIPPIVAWGIEGIHTARYYNMMSHLIATYDRKEFVDIMLKTKANHYFTVPSFVKTLPNNKKLQGRDLSFVKTINHGGEAMTMEEDREIDEELQKHNCFIQTQYGFGQNEEFGCFTINLDIPTIQKEYACCGWPFPGNEIIILDKDSNEVLPKGKNADGTYNIGRIMVSGPTVMQGYYGDDAVRNQDCITYINGKKFIFTGDQGYLDDYGRLWYWTREDRIIRTQDGKIFTNVLEDIINKIDGVKECCVVASPHPVKDKEPSCHIVLEDYVFNMSKEEQNLVKQNIIQKIEEETKKLYFYYIPETYQFRRELLPLTSFGKVAFRQLEEENKEEYERNGGKALKRIRDYI